MAGVGKLLEGKSVCICAGSGGVGKTTTSAAIALGMASRGLKVCVLTIDPAKRLADSLGLRELSNEATRVDPALIERHGVEMEGELWAMMLDAKATFDELVARHADDEESELLAATAERQSEATATLVRAACRAAVGEARRARDQREQLARLSERVEAPVTTLPYLFAPELGRDEIRELADRIG